MSIIQSPNAIYTHQTSGGNLLRRALRLIRAIDPGEDISGAEMRDGLETLNQMLDSWNGERLTVPALGRKDFDMISGQQAYTLGPAGDFDTTQPLTILPGEAYLKIQNMEFRLDVVTQERWAGILLKALVSSIPGTLYYEMGSPLGIANFYPTPDQAYGFILYQRQMLAQIVNASEIIQLLPGYADAIAFNLAIRLAPEYGKTASAEIAAGAMEGKATIKRANIKPMQLEGDPALRHGYWGRFGAEFVSSGSSSGDQLFDEGGLDEGTLS